MDADRFETLMRSLSAVGSRRRSLRTTLGVVLGALGLAASDAADAAKSGTCKPPCGECQRCKKGDCDRKHGKKVCRKGRCKLQRFGTPCTGGTCQSGRCVAPDGPVVPPVADDPAEDPTGGPTGGPPPSSCIPVCPRLQTCTSSSQCPSGTLCVGCTTPVDLRCVPLCAG